MAAHALLRSDAVTYWADETGLIHICESTAPLNNELLVWTLCDREVESGKAFVPSRHEVTCSKCAAADDVLKRRASTHAWSVLD